MSDRITADFHGVLDPAP